MREKTCPIILPLNSLTIDSALHAYWVIQRVLQGPGMADKNLVSSKTFDLFGSIHNNYMIF